MQVAVTGSSGLIGSSLVGALEGAQHRALRVVRREPKTEDEIRWDPANGEIDADGLRGVDAVVHLAGAGIGDERWTEERKEVLWNSRTDSTALLARTLADLDDGPRILLSGSAIGFYGDRGDEILTEESPRGQGFLADLCVAWEESAAPAPAAGIRTAYLRTGIVQSPEGGALAKSLTPFKLGIGGRFGTGQQYWSWISIDDQVRAILHLLTNDISGPVNLTAPEPVTNKHYTKALGRELGRPTILPTPAIGPRLLLGKELADTLLYDSQRVVPAVLDASGFAFRHRTIEAGLAAVLGDTELADRLP